MCPKHMENEKSYIRRMVVFKTLVISKVVFLVLLTKIPHQRSGQRIGENIKICSLENSAGKMKHETTSKNYKDCFLKNVDISYKIVTLQCSWIRLYDMTIFMSGNHCHCI